MTKLFFKKMEKALPQSINQDDKTILKIVNLMEDA
jgi:hypothetical protein